MSKPIIINGVELQPRQADLFNLTKHHKFIMAYGVSRGGKSWLFMLMIILRCLLFPGSNHCVIRQTQSSIDSTIWDTVKEVIDALDPDYRSKLNITLLPRKITFDNGSTIWFFGAQDEEAVQKIMGGQFATIFLNEVVHFSHKTYSKILTRLNSGAVNAKGERIALKVYADCNPETKAHWVYQQWVDLVVPGTKKPLFNPDSFAWLQFDRNANKTVDDSYYDEFQNLSHEEQMSYLMGEWRDEVEGALFSQKDIEDHREDPPETFDEVIVGVDPAMTNTPTSDETGIIAIGCIHTELPSGETRKDIYPLADESGRYHVREWSVKATKTARNLHADAIIIEINQGGDSNVNNLLTADYQANVLTVRPGAGQGKNIRAGQIANAMKAGVVHFPITDPERFKTLETQMLAMTGDYDRKDKTKSPDRLDAFVYAAAELLSGDGGPSPVVTAKAVGFWR